MRILVTPSFERAVKRLQKQQKLALDVAVRAVAADAEIGEAKVGDLAGVRVYKFRLADQLCLLSYRILDAQTIKLLTVDELRIRPARRRMGDVLGKFAQFSPDFMAEGRGLSLEGERDAL